MPCSAMFLFYFLVQKVQKDFKSSLKSHFLAFIFFIKSHRKWKENKKVLLCGCLKHLCAFLGNRDASKVVIISHVCCLTPFTLATVYSHISCWNMRLINTCLLLHWVPQKSLANLASHFTYRKWLLARATLCDQFPGFHHGKQQHWASVDWDIKGKRDSEWKILLGSMHHHA